MMRCLTLFAIVVLVSGCCRPAAHVPFEPPPEPVYREYTVELWRQIPREAREIIVHDQIEMDKYVETVERRAEIHNQ